MPVSNASPGAPRRHPPRPPAPASRWRTSTGRPGGAPRSDVAPATSSGADGRRAAARPASRRGRSAGPEGDPTDDDAVIPGVGGDADVRDPGEHRADDHRTDDQRVGGDGVGEGGVAVGGADDGGADRDAPDRGGSGLLAGARRLADRARRTDRTVLWASGAGAVVVGLVLGTGVGLSVGARSAEPGRATVTPAAGTVTVEQMLDLPQTFADQLPRLHRGPGRAALDAARLHEPLAVGRRGGHAVERVGGGRTGPVDHLPRRHGGPDRGDERLLPPRGRPPRHGLALRDVGQRDAVGAPGRRRGTRHGHEHRHESDVLTAPARAALERS
ncbi:hypothetical protein [Curtobacterium sp. MCJR17_043]|uniref:hypothetical protein n=1 Tax=Curtobacterium sp. MCJR17_043 TaxID=2175660 RepID=UPI0024DF590F|nr:hypothetical protein [Curtobacterium sp. MCJR17_043]WIB34976.1 hypothetical protein DEJ15_10725 [Curtobacterium sp. MCJR17_043]